MTLRKVSPGSQVSWGKLRELEGLGVLVGSQLRRGSRQCQGGAGDCAHWHYGPLQGSAGRLQSAARMVEELQGAVGKGQVRKAIAQCVAAKKSSG